MTTYCMTAKVPLMTTNAERRIHHMQRASYVKQVREAAFWSAKTSKWPQLSAVTIEVRPGQAKGRLADVGAHLPTVKAFVDGLVDAGVLEDDNPEHVNAITFFPPTRSKHDQLVISLCVVTP